MRVVGLALAAALLGGLAPVDASPLCDQTPEPARWSDAGTPDRGADPAVIAVHRGAAELAPENTLDAYRYALAYDVEMVEVDVQQTADHRYVAFHDLDVAPKTDGTGRFPLLTFGQARRLNVADNPKWKGSAYDPSQMPSLEEVLDLVAAHGAGVMFDLKESVTDPATVALMARDRGLLPRSVFIPYVPGRAEAIKAAAPEARLLLSNQGFEELPGGAPPGVFYALTKEYDAFGSSLPGFDAERVAEAHDGCAIVLPNVYQGDVTGTEAGDLRHARAIGADGAQVNRPDVAVDVLDRPVATTLAVSGRQVCLTDAEHGLGLPGKTLVLGDGTTVVTGRGGCAPLPADGRAGRVRWAGDGSALASSVVDAGRT